MAVITLLIAAALAGDHNQTKEIQNGRSTGTALTCAIASAISSAGRQTIAASSQPSKKGQPETPFVKFLEAHGYPPQKVRARQAEAVGDAYVRSIAQRIDSVVGGHKGDGLINKDGSINCDRLAVLSHVAPVRR